MRAIEMLERQDVIAQVVELPGGQDPADFVQEGEIDALRRLLESPRESFPYLTEKALGLTTAPGPRGGKGSGIFCSRSSRPSLPAAGGRIPGRPRGDPGRGRCRRSGGISRRGEPQRRDSGRAVRPRQRAAGGGGRSPAICFSCSRSRRTASCSRSCATAAIALSDLDDERARALFVALEESFRAEETGFDALCARIEDPVLRDLVVRKTASGEFDMNQERLVADGVRRVRQRALRRKIDQLGAEMRKAETGETGSREDARASRGEDASGQRACENEDEGGRGLKTKEQDKPRGERQRRRRRRSSRSSSKASRGAAAAKGGSRPR